MPQGHDHRHGQAHVAAGADLIANQRRSLLAMGHEAIVVAEDGQRDFISQLGDGCQRVPVLDLFEFDSLKPHQGLQ